MSVVLLTDNVSSCTLTYVQFMTQQHRSPWLVDETDRLPDDDFPSILLCRCMSPFLPFHSFTLSTSPNKSN